MLEQYDRAESPPLKRARFDAGRDVVDGDEWGEMGNDSIFDDCVKKDFYFH